MSEDILFKLTRRLGRVIRYYIRKYIFNTDFYKNEAVYNRDQGALVSRIELTIFNFNDLRT